MTRYVHHVPGRLRVRADVFRSNTAARTQILHELSAIDKVRSVHLNERASSVTIHYDGRLAAEQVVALLRLETPQPRQSAAPVSVDTQSSDLVTQVGKATLAFLVNKGVAYSISSLLGVRV